MFIKFLICIELCILFLVFIVYNILIIIFMVVIFLYRVVFLKLKLKLLFKIIIRDMENKVNELKFELNMIVSELRLIFV